MCAKLHANRISQIKTWAGHLYRRRAAKSVQEKIGGENLKAGRSPVVQKVTIKYTPPPPPFCPLECNVDIVMCAPRVRKKELLYVDATCLVLLSQHCV